MPTTEKTVFLTFDDGPTPEITDWVCQQLAEYGFTATFFLIGKNAEKHPDIVAKLKQAGHSIGNHTHNHLKGWRNKTTNYVADTQRAAPFTSTQLFRPPYGRITKNQIAALKAQYKIVMWDVLSLDYDYRISPEQCAKNVTENIAPGSIVVFHDSVKAWPNVQIALPKVLLYLKEQGYKSRKIDI